MKINCLKSLFLKSTIACIATLFAVSVALAEEADLKKSNIDFLGNFSGNWIIQDDTGKEVGSSRVITQYPGAVMSEVRTIGERNPQRLWFVNYEGLGNWAQLFVGPAGKIRQFITTSPAGEWPIIMGNKFVLKNGQPARFQMQIERESKDKFNRILRIQTGSESQWKVIFNYSYIRVQTEE